MATQDHRYVTVIVGEPGRQREQRFLGTKTAVWETSTVAERPVGATGERREPRDEISVVSRTARGQWALHRRWAWHRDVAGDAARNTGTDWNDYTTYELTVYEHLADLTAALPAEFARRVRRAIEPSEPETLDI